MGPHGPGEQLGVEGRGREIEASGEGGFAVAFDLGLDDGEGGEVGKRGSPGKRRSVASQSTWRETR